MSSLDDWMDSVKESVSDAVTQYTPVVEAAALQGAQTVIAAQQKAVQPAASAAVAKGASSPLGAAFSSVIGNATIQNNAGVILLGGAVILYLILK